MVIDFSSVSLLLGLLLHKEIPRASLVTQTVNILPAMQETRVGSWIGMIPWRRKWLPTVVFLPGEFHGQRNLVGYSPGGGKESDTTDGLTLVFPYVSLSLRISLL